MSRPSLDPLDLALVFEAPIGPDRASWLHACFAPAESTLDTDTSDDPDDPGWHPIAFWWPTRTGVQLVLMPCRSVVQ
ncbi:MAG TPA: hypothetical protein VEY67_05350 [Candidatus Dormibacteraeota bacterium]|nr:hypothetical protein [Candidatus Dormibacteraeota bacterium]